MIIYYFYLLKIFCFFFSKTSWWWKGVWKFGCARVAPPFFRPPTEFPFVYSWKWIITSHLSGAGGAVKTWCCFVARTISLSHTHTHIHTFIHTHTKYKHIHLQHIFMYKNEKDTFLPVSPNNVFHSQPTCTKKYRQLFWI